MPGLGAGGIENAARQFGQRRGDMQFVFEQAQARFGDDQMNAGDARIGLQHAERRLGQDRAGSAGHADNDDLALCRFHDV